uniref:Uncharacterized protein n=1 Tax=Nelumbo nucifera TaxID=4432 RepID=A0A822Z510_NELNU|nr:TPA_asm: hypothetical protein HUJ06_013113 [Nelumbo nucifera]
MGEVEVRPSPPVIGEEHTILEVIKIFHFFIQFLCIFFTMIRRLVSSRF